MKCRISGGLSPCIRSICTIWSFFRFASLTFPKLPSPIVSSNWKSSSPPRCSSFRRSASALCGSGWCNSVKSILFAVHKGYRVFIFLLSYLLWLVVPKRGATFDKTRQGIFRTQKREWMWKFTWLMITATDLWWYITIQIAIKGVCRSIEMYVWHGGAKLVIWDIRSRTQTSLKSEEANNFYLWGGMTNKTPQLE